MVVVGVMGMLRPGMKQPAVVESSYELPRVPLRGLGVLTLARDVGMRPITFDVERCANLRYVCLNPPRLSYGLSFVSPIHEPEALQTNHTPIALVCE